MKSKREQPKPTAVGGTIEADGGGGEMIAVARAQRELIDMLARLVLAAEQDANSPPRDSKEGHGGEHGSQNGKPQRADAPGRATKPRDGAGPDLE